MIETARLRIRELALDDAEVVIEILNDPDFIRFVADRGIRTVEAGKRYLQEGPLNSYRQHGFGLWAVELKTADKSLVPDKSLVFDKPLVPDKPLVIGMCGLLQRDFLAAPDIGFAFLPKYRGYGYAFEAAQATLNYGWQQLGMTRILAITDPQNEDSIRLLTRLGLEFSGMTTHPGSDVQLNLYWFDGSREE